MHNAPFSFLQIEQNYEKICHFLHSLSSVHWPQEVSIHTDGASRGNPGPAAMGVYVANREGEEVEELALYIGQTTNNYAEYFAVFVALELALKKGVLSLHLFTDSQLLERQLKGKYRIKAEGLKAIYKICQQLVGNLNSFHLHHIKREFNKKADALANRALDESVF